MSQQHQGPQVGLIENWKDQYDDLLREATAMVANRPGFEPGVVEETVSLTFAMMARDPSLFSVDQELRAKQVAGQRKAIMTIITRVLRRLDGAPCVDCSPQGVPKNPSLFTANHLIQTLYDHLNDAGVRFGNVEGHQPADLLAFAIDKHCDRFPFEPWSRVSFEVTRAVLVRTVWQGVKALIKRRLERDAILRHTPVMKQLEALEKSDAPLTRPLTTAQRDRLRGRTPAEDTVPVWQDREPNDPLTSVISRQHLTLLRLALVERDDVVAVALFDIIVERAATGTGPKSGDASRGDRVILVEALAERGIACTVSDVTNAKRRIADAVVRLQRMDRSERED